MKLKWIEFNKNEKVKTDALLCMHCIKQIKTILCKQTRKKNVMKK